MIFFLLPVVILLGWICFLQWRIYVLLSGVELDEGIKGYIRSLLEKVGVGGEGGDEFIDTD